MDHGAKTMQNEQHSNAEHMEAQQEMSPEAAEEVKKAMTAADRQYATQRNVPNRIYILGTGSIGKLVAHSLRGIPDPPPVTLLMHRFRLLQQWERSKKVITLKDGEFTVPRGGFDVELTPPSNRQYGIRQKHGKPDIYQLADEAGVEPHEVAEVVRSQQSEEEKAQTAYEPIGTEGRKSLPGDYAMSNEPIYNLIVTTKTIRTIPALLSLKDRISKDTTICFLQNGMGVIDDVNKEVFPDESTRPNYVQGIVSHGANVPRETAASDPFYVIHAGHGTIALGAIPRLSTGWRSDRPPTPTGPDTDNDGKLSDEQMNTDVAPTGRYIIRTMARTPVLAAVAFTPIELLQLQLEKLAVNSILNPLTALIDNRNGAITHNFHFTRTMRLMLAETSLIIRSLPELRGIPTVPHRFSAARLETLVISVAHKTRNNISSMLADVRRGAMTEIEYINGYVVKRGEEMGVKAVVNYGIMQVVMGKSLMAQQEKDDEVPVEGDVSGKRWEGYNRE